MRLKLTAYPCWRRRLLLSLPASSSASQILNSQGGRPLHEDLKTAVRCLKEQKPALVCKGAEMYKVHHLRLRASPRGRKEVHNLQAPPVRCNLIFHQSLRR